MSEAFYSHARLYDLMFPGGGPAVDFYRTGVPVRQACQDLSERPGHQAR